MLRLPGRHAGSGGGGEADAGERVGVMFARAGLGQRILDDPLTLASVHVIEGLRQPRLRQRAHVGGLSLREKLRDVVGTDGDTGQARFEPAQPERRQHQKRRDQRHQQQRHKLKVNTAKISAGLQNQYSVGGDSG